MCSGKYLSFYITYYTTFIYKIENIISLKYFFVNHVFIHYHHLHLSTKHAPLLKIPSPQVAVRQYVISELIPEHYTGISSLITNCRTARVASNVSQTSHQIHGIARA